LWWELGPKRGYYSYKAVGGLRAGIIEYSGVKLYIQIARNTETKLRLQATDIQSKYHGVNVFMHVLLRIPSAMGHLHAITGASPFTCLHPRSCIICIFDIRVMPTRIAWWTPCDATDASGLTRIQLSPLALTWTCLCTCIHLDLLYLA
jgi:hypothetical protein